MKIKEISSSKLRCLTGTIKDLINMGVWFLYEVHNESGMDVSYLLEGAGGYHLLTSDGTIVKLYLSILENLNVKHKFCLKIFLL